MPPSAAVRVLIWNEFRHERENPAVKAIYPHGIHAAIADGLRESLGDAVDVQTATLDDPEQGLTAERLAQTDVLLWWGHMAHDDVEEARVDLVQQRVLAGMGLIALHSAHASKPFRRLMGTGCMLRWREAAEKERLWIVAPGHPLVSGIDEEFFELSEAEMYGEYFDVPPPEELVLVSWFAGGEVFRSGCVWQRGLGKIFYFRPGHETYPIYFDANIRRVLANAVRWAAPSGGTYRGDARHIPDPLERWSGAE